MLTSQMRVRLVNGIEMSIVKGFGTYSDSTSSEVAFIAPDGEFIKFPLFGKGWDWGVYPWVSDERIKQFLNNSFGDVLPNEYGIDTLTL